MISRQPSLLDRLTAGHPPGCCCNACVACAGLECLERPRYFAGQLLTEADLRSEQSYMLAKQRLHNRYLHGQGVVCGLQVACNSCDGWVTVHPGYAIDPCGNDVVVCAAHEYNLIKAIRECRDRERVQGRCEPVRPRRSDVKQVEEHWCVTLKYQEQEARPATALRRDQPAGGCSCGGGKSCSCGGGKSCSCGGGKSCSCNGRAGANSAKSGGRSNTACEPTRIFEGYSLGVYKADECSCGLPPLGRDKRDPLAGLVTPDSLLGRVLACALTVQKFLFRRVPAASRKRIYDVASYAERASAPRLDEHYSSLSQYYNAVRALFVENPLNTRCELAAMLDKIDVPAPQDDETSMAYVERIRAPVYDLSALVVQYLIDCVCQALMPPCPPAPCDDRLVLACVVVRGDTIVRICNFSCREYAGSFRSLGYWLSALPVIPLLRLGLELLCCSPDLLRANSPLVNELARMLEKFDPDGRLRRELVAEDFALPRGLLSRLRDRAGGLNLEALLDAVRPRGVNLATLVGQDSERAGASLERAGVNVTMREVASRDEARRTSRVSAPNFAGKGEQIIVYTMGGQVVGYGAYDAEAQLRDLRAEIEALRAEVGKASRRTRGKAGEGAEP